MIKSFTLLAATNLAVMAMMSVIISVLQQMGVIPQGGFLGLIVMSAIMGFAGATISLFMSKSMAKRNLHMITQPSNEMESWLMTTVARQAKAAGIDMPEVGIQQSDGMNAFATGPSKNSSLVAVTTGLMNGMTRDEVEAVLAHEICHAANGDMVAMTLVQGVVNTFVMVFAQIIGGVVDNALSGGRNRGGRRGMGFQIGYMVAQAALGFLATIIVRWFSRMREFRADSGAARLSDPNKMIAALERLKTQDPPQMPASLQTMGISGGVKSLFATHPPLDQRIAALRAAS